MTVYLVDSHVYVFRAYHALPPMHAPDGTPVHAAYGFASTLVRMLAQWQPTHFACAFDAAMTSFRNALEPGYKAGRTEAPADLEPQFVLCTEIAAALGAAVLSAPDFEADDVIATVAERVLADGERVVVVSADKDLTQLVREDGSVVCFDFARTAASTRTACARASASRPRRSPTSRAGRGRGGQPARRGGNRPQDGGAAARELWPHRGRARATRGPGATQECAAPSRSRRAGRGARRRTAHPRTRDAASRRARHGAGRRCAGLARPGSRALARTLRSSRLAGHRAQGRDARCESIAQTRRVRLEWRAAGGRRGADPARTRPARTHPGRTLFVHDLTKEEDRWTSSRR